MWRYDFYPPDLNKIAALPCENYNNENLKNSWILPTKHNMLISFVKIDHGRVPYIYTLYNEDYCVMVMSSVTSLIVHLIQTGYYRRCN